MEVDSAKLTLEMHNHLYVQGLTRENLAHLAVLHYAYIFLLVLIDKDLAT